MHDINFPVYVKKDDDKYIAGCPHLRAFSHADTERAAISNAYEVIFYQIQDAVDADEIDKLIADCMKPIALDKPNEIDMAGFIEVSVLTLPFSFFSVGILNDPQAQIYTAHPI